MACLKMACVSETESTRKKVREESENVRKLVGAQTSEKDTRFF